MATLVPDDGALTATGLARDSVERGVECRFSLQQLNCASTAILRIFVPSRGNQPSPRCTPVGFLYSSQTVPFGAPFAGKPPDCSIALLPGNDLGRQAYVGNSYRIGQKSV